MSISRMFLFVVAASGAACTADVADTTSKPPATAPNVPAQGTVVDLSLGKVA